MTLTTKQINDLNKANRAAQNVALGSLVDILITNLLPQSSASMISGSIATAGSSVLIQGSSGSRIIVSSILIQNQSSGSPVYILRDGTVDKINFLAFNQGDGLGINYPSDVRWILTDGSPLVLNISGSNLTTYTISYYKG